jgi:DNA repair exonuclease SbcCD ATPase subunit
MAQIIASRASQFNFQIVVITHDKDFVTMMKHELSAQRGLRMVSGFGHFGRCISLALT